MNIPIIDENKMLKNKYDAVVIGSGPNGLAAAIRLQQEGLSVLVLEGKDTVGGGLRSSELILPGYIHDICSAIHPLAVQSPFFKTLPLSEHGLTYIYPPVLTAHPMDDGQSIALYQSLTQTAEQFGVDKQSYLDLFRSMSDTWPNLIEDVLAPLDVPKYPLSMLQFAYKAIQPATRIAKSFKTDTLKALWAGMAAHSMLPLTSATTSAVAMVLTLAGHSGGWPIAEGGSQSIANALVSYFKSLGGEVITNYYVDSLNMLPDTKAILFDIGPKQMLEIAGEKFSSYYQKQLKKYRYGMGVFKMDWVLENPVPFKSDASKLAGTIHLGGSLKEISTAEQSVWEGKHPEKPFVLLAQQSVFDSSRVVNNKQVLWAYCHVPNGSTYDMTDAIENQIERFAPGFRDCIVAKKTTNSQEMEAYNPNYIGGDINGGAMDLGQLFTRPTLQWSPYRTSNKGMYICSSSTPPGGGVHGMCGYHAAQRVLKDLF